jgi:hypothetical protein
VNLLNQPGLQGSWNNPFSSNGTVQDLDFDGDMDIGGDSSISTAGYALGRVAAAPAYSGQGSAAEFLVYRFAAQITGDGIGGSLNVQRHASADAFAWQEDGVAKNPNTDFLTIARGIHFPCPNRARVLLRCSPLRALPWPSAAE